jgi:hypothetical protein
MPTLKLISKKAMNKTVAPLRPVQDEVESAANRLARAATARLAPHKKSAPGHHVKVEKILNVKYGFLDYYVSLVGPAPLSVEFGHRHNNSGRWVQGLYILSRLL